MSVQAGGHLESGREGRRSSGPQTGRNSQAGGHSFSKVDDRLPDAKRMAVVTKVGVQAGGRLKVGVQAGGRCKSERAHGSCHAGPGYLGGISAER